MDFHKSVISRKVAVAISGGGAFGAFAWGVLDALLDAEIEIIAASGASTGALTAAHLIEGLRKGGRALARRRIRQCWVGLHHYQTSQMPHWFDTTKSMHEIGMAGMQGFAPFAQMMLRATEEFGISTRTLQQSFVSLLGEMPRTFVKNTEQALLSSLGMASDESPILGFLEAMKKKKQGLDFKALREPNGHPLYVSATSARVSHWHATGKSHGRTFEGADITPHVLAASGCIAELSSPIEIDGELLHDGAYSRNPDLVQLAKLCSEQDATLIIIRTHPEANPGRSKRHTSPSSDAQRQEHFNWVLNSEIQLARKKWPDVEMHIFEPDEIEGDGEFMKPELLFDLPHLMMRRKLGSAAAAMALNQ